MTTRTFQIYPSIAAVLQVIEEAPNAPIQTVIYLSEESGIVVNHTDTTLDSMDWPSGLKKLISTHFKHVFALEHEEWKSKEPSPRQLMVDSLKPWVISFEQKEVNGSHYCTQ